MRTIDGSLGGGQVLRTALTLSVLCDQPVTVEHIRGARENPGLRAQHTACIHLLADLTDAEVTGAEVGAQTISFTPQSPPSGHVDIDIGTAGSITLLFESVLPLGSVLDDQISVTATGGTDVRWSPTMDYLEHVKLPLLTDYGHRLDLEVAQRGYYPVGGGRATVTVHPATPTTIDLTEADSLEGASVFSRASEQLRQAEVAERQVAGVESVLDGASISIEHAEAAYHDVPSTGTSVTVVGHFAGGYGGGDAIGERGKPAETVGTEAAEALLACATEPGAVDRHLADQLMLPLALSGGRLTIPTVTDHVESNRAVLSSFDVEVSIEHHEDGSATLAVDDPLTR